MDLVQSVKAFFSDKRYPFVLLFGSYGSGTATNTSDIDIGIFYDGEIDYMDLGYQTALIESKVEKSVDMIALNGIQKRDPHFGFEILQNHTPLLVNDFDLYVAFKTACQLSYLDHKPLIEMNEKVLRRRIAQNQIGERDYVAES